MIQAGLNTSGMEQGISMNTTSEERTTASWTQDDDFLTYPLYKVVSVFSDDKEV